MVFLYSEFIGNGDAKKIPPKLPTNQETLNILSKALDTALTNPSLSKEFLAAIKQLGVATESVGPVKERPLPSSR